MRRVSWFWLFCGGGILGRVRKMGWKWYVYILMPPSFCHVKQSMQSDQSPVKEVKVTSESRFAYWHVLHWSASFLVAERAGRCQIQNTVCKPHSIPIVFQRAIAVIYTYDPSKFQRLSLCFACSAINLCFVATFDLRADSLYLFVAPLHPLLVGRYSMYARCARNDNQRGLPLNQYLQWWTMNVRSCQGILKVIE